MRTAATLTGLVLVVSALTAAPAQAETCPVLLPAPMSGPAAVASLGPGLADVAALAGMSQTELRETLLEDSTAGVTTCGRLFYADPVPSGILPQTQVSALQPGTDAFALHSRPSSDRTIYLDFDGYEVTPGTWGADYGTFTGPPYSTDANPAFSASERAQIVDIWLRVAEDYAPFDVDVTTEEPSEEDLTRSSAQDIKYGTRVVIIDGSNPIVDDCQCAGLAVVGVFNDFREHARYQPAFVFAELLHSNTKLLGDTASHEAGHTLGLEHDGTPTNDYYSGENVWAPIMGNGGRRPLSQWSKGEYPNATEQQDDVAVISAMGAPAMADDVPDLRAYATPVVAGVASGIIGTQDDVDWFRFEAQGLTKVSVRPAAVSPNLDTKLSLYDANGQVIAEDNPTSAVTTFDVASGLDASITRTLSAGSYYVKVDGVGSGSPVAGGYSDYGSLGRYDLTITQSSPLAMAPVDAPVGAVGSPFAMTVSATGGTPPYRFAVSSGSLPPAVTLGANGALSGVPSQAGQYTFGIGVTDSAGGTASRSFTVTIAPRLTIAAQTPGPAMVGREYSHYVTASGGIGSLTFSAGAGVPPGLQLDATGRLFGVPTAAGSFGFDVTVTDGRSTVSQKVTVLVGQPLTLDAITLPPASVDWPYQVGLTAAGGSGPYFYRLESGSLPPGLRFTSNGELSGPPLSAGQYAFTISANDGGGFRTSTNYVLQVVPALQVGAEVPPDATTGTPYSHRVTASGGTAPYTFEVVGTLPAGLTMTASGLVSGVPTAATRSAVTVRVVDANQVQTSRQLTFVVQGAPKPIKTVKIQTKKVPKATVGVRYLTQLRATMAGTWRMTADRVPGLKLTAGGVLKGKPKKAGTYTFTVSITAGTTASRKLTLAVRR